MTDIFNEIDEEVRRDKVKSWWKNNMASLIIGCVVAVAGVAGYKFWQNQQLSTAQEATAEYYSALKELRADKSNVQSLDSVIDKYPQSVGILAEFNKAQLFSKAGKTKEAIAIYDKISASAKEDVFRQAALIRSGYLQIDTASLQDMQSKLGILNKDTNPWRNNAREILGLSAWRAGEVQKAHEFFNQILADRQASPGVFRRAQVMAALIAPKLK